MSDRLRLPPPSDPPEQRTHGSSYRDDRCPLCPHEWHGLFCRKGGGSCNCQSSIPRDQLEEWEGGRVEERPAPEEMEMW